MRFDRKWFEKHQAPLIRFVNSRLGRWFFDIRNNDIPFSTRIMEIWPNRVSVNYKIRRDQFGYRLEKTTIFRSNNRYQLRLQSVYKRALRLFGAGVTATIFRPAQNAVFGLALPLFALTTDTFFPDPSPYTTTCAAAARYYGVDVSWSTLHDAATGTDGDMGSSYGRCGGFTCSNTTNQFSRMDRGFFLFDTSALDNAAVISAATLSLYGQNKVDADTAVTPNLNIYASTPAANNVIVAADYDQVGTTAFATAIGYSSWSTSGYNDFVLNASGIAAISLTGVSKFGSRNANYDAANSAPTWSSNSGHYLVCYYPDQTGTSNDPKLSVTYTVPTAWTKTVTDTTTSTASIKKDTTRSLANVITSTASVLKSTTRSLADVITTSTAGTSAVRQAIKTVLDTITTTTSVVRAITRVVADTVTAVASRVAAVTRTLSNAVSATGSAVKSTTKVVLDTITTTTLITKLLNGASTIWTAASKAAATWTAAAKNAASWINGNKSS